MRNLARSFIVVLAVLSVLFLSACFNFGSKGTIPKEKRNIEYVNRQQVKGKKELRAIANESYYFRFFNVSEDTALKTTGIPIETTENLTPDRVYTDTNVQVENVDEADIIKTDGNYIYYRKTNGVYIFNILEDGELEIKDIIETENSFVYDLLINDDYLIVIGNIYDTQLQGQKRLSIIYPIIYYNYKGFVKVYDKESLELKYELITNNGFNNYRMIDNNLFLTYTHYVSTTSLLPSYEETIDDVSSNVTLPYYKVYYFDDELISTLNVFSCLNLNTFKLNSEAYATYIENFYMNEENIYVTNTKYLYNEKSNYTVTTNIIKFTFDVEKGKFTYLGIGNIKGHVQNSYWMDEYENHLRVVSTNWGPINNFLYILAEDSKTDSLNIVGKIDKNLGKTNETVKSVRFAGDKGYVVTFQQTDPLYTIELSDPTNPIIINAIEEPGFSTYLHVWDDLGHLIGFGYDANELGITRGLKISAYSDSIEDPLYTYLLSNENNSLSNWRYSEALHNPRAMMIDQKIGIIGFPVSGYAFDTEKGYYTYMSNYYIFFVDFNSEKIISDPIVIKHRNDTSAFYVERGIYIKDSNFEIIYTFSNSMVVSYDLKNDKTKQTIILN